MRTAPIVYSYSRNIRDPWTLTAVSADAMSRALHGNPRPAGQLWDRLAEADVFGRYQMSVLTDRQADVIYEWLYDPNRREARILGIDRGELATQSADTHRSGVIRAGELHVS